MKRPSHFKDLLSLIGSLILGIYTYVFLITDRFSSFSLGDFLSNLIICKTTVNERLMKYIRRKREKPSLLTCNTRIVEIPQQSRFLAHLTKLKISLCCHNILVFDDNCHFYLWLLSHFERKHKWPLFREMKFTLVSVVIS